MGFNFVSLDGWDKFVSGSRLTKFISGIKQHLLTLFSDILFSDIFEANLSLLLPARWFYPVLSS
jgi:hypothetical protein